MADTFARLTSIRASPLSVSVRVAILLLCSEGYVDNAGERIPLSVTMFGLTNPRTRGSFRFAGITSKLVIRHGAPFGVAGDGGQTEPGLRCEAIQPDGTPGGTSREEAKGREAGSKLRAGGRRESSLGCFPGSEPAVPWDGRAVSMATLFSTKVLQRNPGVRLQSAIPPPPRATILMLSDALSHEFTLLTTTTGGVRESLSLPSVLDATSPPPILKHPRRIPYAMMRSTDFLVVVRYRLATSSFTAQLEGGPPSVLAVIGSGPRSEQRRTSPMGRCISGHPLQAHPSWPRGEST